MGMAEFLLAQRNWQWWEDDAAEPTVSLAAENVKPTLANNTDKIRLRINIAETGDAAASNVAFTFEYSLNDTDWFTPGPATHWDYANGLATEGNTVAGLLLGDTDTAAEYVESAGGAGTFDYAGLEEAEWDLCVVPTANVTGTATYYFRILIDAVEVALGGSETHAQVLTAGNIFPKAADGAITFVGAPTKKPHKPNAGAITFAGASARTMKFARSSVAGALTFVGAVKGKGKKALAGAASFVGAIAKKPHKPLAGAVSFVGAPAKKPHKPLAGAVTFAGAVATVKMVLLALAGAVTFAGAAAKKALKPLGGAAPFAGALAKKPHKSLEGAVSFAGAVVGKGLKALAGAVSFAGGLLPKALKALAGAWNGSGVVAGVQSATETLYYQAVAGDLTFAGAVTKLPKKAFAGAITFAGAVARATSRALAGALTFAGDLAGHMGMIDLIPQERSAALAAGERSTAHSLATRTKALALVTRDAAQTLVARATGFTIKERP